MEFKYKDIVFNNKLVLNKGCIEFNKGQITIITGEVAVEKQPYLG